jgi:hypothetical protein
VSREITRGATALEKKAKSRTYRTVVYKHRAIADRELDVDGFVRTAVEAAMLLHPNAVSLRSGKWPVVTGCIIEARVTLEVEV